MPKINVYLPDDLAEAVRDAGVPVSAICQRALEAAVRRVTAIRRTVLGDLDQEQLAARLPHFTARAVTALSLATDRARETGAPNVTSAHLLHGMLAEGGNLALQILGAMDIDPATITVPAGTEPAGAAGEGLRFSTPAANVVELAVTEATSLGHNYVGCEHLLIALAAEPDGLAGRALADRGADSRATRRAVAAATAGYAHLRASTPAPEVLTAVRAELAPLIRRIEALEVSRA
ncbi:Clp protease N-terminal domain-containing protein [Pseudosporangium ferrugineum]|uniref:ATP-dependent Clp protease ATP-binding subunit ClpC n=1 Tax=Pseudosporangium ferrugineum TaxID=439699 RepID=A0A2T0S257_9ACTN|nr:Clp protease N-terminal domain-containing protein [Pseudosporangium ferrugineum]PRY27501.1 ATP-dependent Clp protease ATP-binding subunit ClpC [Pseudosporangium ferrugineum]